MKIQSIKNIGTLAATGILITGAVLLWNKGIVPVCTITLLLMAGSIVSWLFSTIRLTIKLLIAAIILTILV
ncbi:MULTISPECIES: hypothetical protein [Bacteroidaceae]|uniref:hypothetical protein n=1 Tax=Bacteroidaceae TaxID=815 RepID=UPI0015E72B80|nr:hypothetical protein [Phocaeicola faecicola]